MMWSNICYHYQSWRVGLEMDLSFVRIWLDLSIGQSDQRTNNGRSGNSALWTWSCSRRTYSMDYVLWWIILWSRSWDRDRPYLISMNKLRVFHPKWKNFNKQSGWVPSSTKGDKATARSQCWSCWDIWRFSAHDKSIGRRMWMQRWCINSLSWRMPSVTSRVQDGKTLAYP
jgi:hypothetical protein